MTATATVLRKAAELIRERGWRQGDLGQERYDGPVCATEAICRLEGYPLPEKSEARRALYEVLGLEGIGEEARIGTFEWGPGINWNDAPGRTVEEVLAAFESAAQAEEARS